MSGPVAVLDACALAPIRLATTLLWLAEAGLFQPIWSGPILDEVRRNLPKVGVTPEQAGRRIGMMREAFGTEALVDGFAALERETAAFRNPPETVTQFLATLTATVLMFANLAADAFSDSPEAVSTVPALVEADDEKAIAALGEPGDLTNPAQVAFVWWAGLLDDLDLARELTYHPLPWGDYQWAMNDLAGRSLASKVIRAVDAPNQIAFMRFVPEVAATAQVFESYLTTMTFLTLEGRQRDVARLGARASHPLCERHLRRLKTRLARPLQRATAWTKVADLARGVGVVARRLM